MDSVDSAIQLLQQGGKAQPQQPTAPDPVANAMQMIGGNKSDDNQGEVKVKKQESEIDPFDDPSSIPF